MTSANLTVRRTKVRISLSGGEGNHSRHDIIVPRRNTGRFRRSLVSSSDGGGVD